MSIDKQDTMESVKEVQYFYKISLWMFMTLSLNKKADCKGSVLTHKNWKYTLLHLDKVFLLVG